MPEYRVSDRHQRRYTNDGEYFNPGEVVEVRDPEPDIDGEVYADTGAGFGYILLSALEPVAAPDTLAQDFADVEPQKPLATTEREALALARANYAFVLWHRGQAQTNPQVQAIADATGKDYAEAKALYDAGLRLKED